MTQFTKRAQKLSKPSKRTKTHSTKIKTKMIGTIAATEAIAVTETETTPESEQMTIGMKEEIPRKVAL